MWVMLWAAMAAWAEPVDEAIDALVDGRERRALQILRGALDDDPDGTHRCLLGEVALQVGRTDEALDVLQEVPEDALCAGRAAFVRAEALRRSDQLGEAADRYEALTDSLLSPSTQPLAARLEAWAQRLLDEDPPDRGTAASLLAAAAKLEADGSARRLDLVRRIAELQPRRSSADALILARTELARAIAEADDLAAADRRRLAPLLDQARGLELLAPLPDDPATMAVRVRVVRDGALAVRDSLATALVAAHPDSGEAAEIRLEVGQALAEAGWLSEARRLLQPLTERQDDDARAAAWTLARLAVRAGDAGAADKLDELLERYPTAPFRSEVEALRDQLELDGLRAAAAAGDFDGEAWDRVATGPTLALEAAWATPDVDERIRRLDALVARWPWSPEAREALRHRALTHPDGLAWLRARADVSVAGEVLSELQEPEIGIRTPDDTGAAEVQLLTRGLGEVEMRLHHIDVEGWLRAGGRPGSLGDLDVAIVAPDRTWTVSVPDDGVQAQFTVPVPVPGPGLYAVTAATTDREARTLLLVSDARVLARAQGPDVAMVALRDGAPSPAARFWLRAGGQMLQVRAGRDGLARAELPSAPAVIVADTPGGPAILEVGESFTPDADPVRTAVDLDRPVYRPGDVVRFRAVATRGGDPVRGDWRVSLVGPAGAVFQSVRASADRAGTVEGEVVVPWTSTGWQSHGAGRRDLTLRALPPGYDTEIQLAAVPVIDETPGARRLELLPEAEGVRVVVSDADGAPVVDQPVGVWVDDAPARWPHTDDTGSLWVEAPPDGLPWGISAALPDERGGAGSWDRDAPEGPEQWLRLDDPRAAPGEAIPLRLEGEGEALLRVVRLSAERGRPAAVSAPAGFEVPSLEVFEAQDDAQSVEGGLRETVSARRVTLTEAGATETLEGLPEGRYRIELVRPDGSAATRSVALEVRSGTRIRLSDAPVVGRAASVSVDGGWALLTAESGRMLAARLVPPGRARTLEVDRRWHGEVRLVATTAADQHTRTVDVDAALQVALDASLSGGRWDISGQVTDAAGNPQRARVVVRAVDALLLDEMGEPPTLSTGLLERRVSWVASAARAWQLRHGGWAELLSDELLAEARREAEERRKRLAAEGRLAESRVAEVLDADVPLEAAAMGVAGSGYGGGGGGFGSKGMGRVGSVGGKAMALGSQGYTLYGARSVGLWRVVETDRDGRFVVDADAPDRRRTWVVDAIAVVPGSLGKARQTVAPSPEPWLVTDVLQAGWPGDVAHPRVRVVNPGTEARTVRIRGGELDEEHTLRPGAVVTASLGALEVGQSVGVRIEVDGREVDRTELSFPLAEGVPVEDGAVSVQIRGIAGGTVAAAVALMDDPEIVRDPAHAVSAARSALAVLPVLTEAEHERAIRRVWAGVSVARDRISGMDPRDGAQALLLIAEAAPVLGLPRHVVEQAATALNPEPETPRERLELAFARASADVAVQEATVGRLLRDVEHLDDEGRGLLARLLERLDTQPSAELSAGGGVQWILHRDERRGRADTGGVLDIPPPVLGHPERADWVRAVVLEIGDAPGTDQAGPGWERMGDAGASAAALSWTEAMPEGEAVDRAHRWPAGLSGRVATVRRSTMSLDGDPALRCGTADAPCRVSVGDAVSPWDQVPPAGGLRLVDGGRRLQATTPGRYTLWDEQTRGWRALHVEVVDDAGDETLTPLGQGEVLAVARQRSEAEMPFAHLLASRPSLEDWHPDLQAAAAQLRLDAADPGDPAGWIAAFEDLRDEVPTASITADDVLATARAYHRMGRPQRAIRVYERAIGQVFLEEAAVVADVGTLVGTLAGLQALREVTLRYPAVPVVRQSEFALPDRLLGLVGNIPDKARARGVTDTELRLMAAAWDRRFVALAPDSPLAPEAGLRLATGLIELGARERALGWVQRLQRAHPEHALTDRWMLLEALMLTELSRPERAGRVLQRLSEEEVPLGGGRLGPSELRDDARLSLARLAEAERRWDDAAERYRQVSGTFPEATLSAAALTGVGLAVDEPLVTHPLREGSRLRVWATNVDAVQVRAYAVDLRTLFLRDSGLPAPESVRIDGLRPAWSGTRFVEAGPFPVERWVDLPLEGPGAWLVRLDADGASTLAWVLRSDLEVHHTDRDGMRRLTARLRGAPVAEARVRAMSTMGIVAETTDIRGVAVVGQGSAALVQSGPHFAVTEDVVPGRVQGAAGATGAPRPSQPSLLDRVRGREESRRQKRRAQYDYIGTEAAPAVQASEL